MLPASSRRRSWDRRAPRVRLGGGAGPRPSLLHCRAAARSTSTVWDCRRQRLPRTSRCTGSLGRVSRPAPTIRDLATAPGLQCLSARRASRAFGDSATAADGLSGAGDWLRAGARRRLELESGRQLQALCASEVPIGPGRGGSWIDHSMRVVGRPTRRAAGGQRAADPGHRVAGRSGVHHHRLSRGLADLRRSLEGAARGPGEQTMYHRGRLGRHAPGSARDVQHVLDVST
jgi:hypothetical protein